MPCGFCYVLDEFQSASAPAVPRNQPIPLTPEVAQQFQSASAPAVPRNAITANGVTPESAFQSASAPAVPRNYEWQTLHSQSAGFNPPRHQRCRGT